MSLRVLARAIGTPLFGVVFGHFFDKHRIARVGIILLACLHLPFGADFLFVSMTRFSKVTSSVACGLL